MSTKRMELRSALRKLIGLTKCSQSQKLALVTIASVKQALALRLVRASKTWAMWVALPTSLRASSVAFLGVWVRLGADEGVPPEVMTYGSTSSSTFAKQFLVAKKKFASVT